MSLVTYSLLSCRLLDLQGRVASASRQRRHDGLHHFTPDTCVGHSRLQDVRSKLGEGSSQDV